MVRPWANEWIHGVPSARRMILGDAAPVVDALQRVGQRLSLEALRVRQHVADGAAGQRRVIERQLNIRPQYALALSDDDLSRGGSRDMPVRATSFLACASTNAARALAISGASRSRSLALSSSSRDRSTIVSGGHTATVSSATPSTAIGRRLALSCCSGGTRTGPPSNTRRSGPPTIRSTMERSSRAPLELTIIQPNPASQQRSCSARRKRSLSAPSFAAT